MCMRWRCRAARCMRAAFSFTTAGGNAANGIAQWNGSSWSALGSGISRWRCVCAGGVGQHVVCGRQFSRAGGNDANNIAQWNGSSWSALGSGEFQGWARMVRPLYVCAGGVGQHVVCGRRFLDGGRQRGQLHRAMEREQLVGPRFGDERRCGCAGGVGQHVVCGRRFHDGGRHRGQLHRAMEREQLVGPRFGDERRYPMCMRWRCRAAHCMRAAISRRRAAVSANYIAQWNGSSWSALGSGMKRRCVCAGGVGQHVVCGRRFHDGGRRRGQLHRAMEREQLVGPGFGDGQCIVYALAVSGGTLYAGGDFTTAGGSAANYIAQWNGSSWSALGSGMNDDMCMRWRCRAARCMRAAISRRRAVTPVPITSRNGTGAVGRPSVRGFQVEVRLWIRPLCVCAGGVGQHAVCGRRFHDGGHQRLCLCGHGQPARFPLPSSPPTRRLASRMGCLVSTCPARPAPTWSFRPARTCKPGFRCKPICSAAGRSISPIRSPPPTSSVSTAPNYRRNAGRLIRA